MHVIAVLLVAGAVFMFLRHFALASRKTDMFISGDEENLMGCIANHDPLQGFDRAAIPAQCRRGYKTHVY